MRLMPGTVPEKPVDGASYHKMIIAEYSCTNQQEYTAPEAFGSLPRQTSVSREAFKRANLVNGTLYRFEKPRAYIRAIH